MWQEVETPYGPIVMREVHPLMLPPGKWWHLLPSPVNGHPCILTSDPSRFRAEVDEELAKRAGASP